MVYNKQLSGLKKAKNIVDPDLSLNDKIYKKSKLNVNRFFVPLLFKENKIKLSEINPFLEKIISEIRKSDFSIFWNAELNGPYLPYNLWNVNPPWTVRFTYTFWNVSPLCGGGQAGGSGRPGSS